MSLYTQLLLSYTEQDICLKNSKCYSGRGCVKCVRPHYKQRQQWSHILLDVQHQKKITRPARKRTSILSYVTELVMLIFVVKWQRERKTSVLILKSQITSAFTYVYVTLT